MKKHTYKYQNDEQSFRYFQSTKQIFTPEQVPDLTGGEPENYAEVECILVYDGDMPIFQIKDGESWHYDIDTTTKKYMIDPRLDELIESDDLETIERALFQHCLRMNYFD